MSAQTKTTTMSSREFNQHTSKAKRAANAGPVVITDRGKPAYVLLTNEEFERLTQAAPPERFVSILEALAQKGGPEYDFEVDFPRLQDVGRPFEFDPE